MKDFCKDASALDIYEYLVNNIETLTKEDVSTIAEKIIRNDADGRMAVSTALYLSKVDAEKYSAVIDALVKHAIENDRERKYIGTLLVSIWGENYEQRADSLIMTDNNFRRIYKRLFAGGI